MPWGKIAEGGDTCLGIFVPATTKLEQLDQLIDKAIPENKAFAADSLDDLVKKIGVNQDKLKAAAAEINRAAEQNQDKVFGKGSRYLLPIKKEKFYAVNSSRIAAENALAYIK